MLKHDLPGTFTCLVNYLITGNCLLKMIPVWRLVQWQLKSRGTRIQDYHQSLESNITFSLSFDVNYLSAYQFDPATSFFALKVS